MARDIILRATFQELVGDETYELWLQHESDDWELNQAGDVVLDEGAQLYTLLSLTAGDGYVAQVRLKRAGRYRVGYLSGNPDTWPSQSRCEFTPGALAGIGAPTIDSGVWDRVDVDTQKITLTITPDDEDVDVAIFRDGVEIAVVPAPLTSPFTYDDTDPTIATVFDYTAKHKTGGGLYSAVSNTETVFSGPLPPTDFVLVSATDHFGSYTVSWDADGDPVRLQDDYLCTEIWANQIGGPGTTTDSSEEVNKEMEVIPEGGTMPATFHARVRREIDGDVSDWVTVLVEMLLNDDNTDYQSCP